MVHHQFHRVSSVRRSVGTARWALGEHSAGLLGEQARRRSMGLVVYTVHAVSMVTGKKNLQRTYKGYSNRFQSISPQIDYNVEPTLTKYFESTWWDW